MIEIKNLTKSRDGETVLDQLSLSLPDRGIVCITGPSGCGKTTLANIVAGIDRRYSGTIQVDGVDLSSLSHNELDRWRSKTIGFVFQNFQLLDGLSVIENVLVAADLHDDKNNTAHEYAKKLLSDLGLDQAIERPVETLSGGEQQRTAIARALVWNAPIIIADEPTGSLDAENAKSVINTLSSVARDRLVIIITHDCDLLPIADIVITMQEDHTTIEAKDRQPMPLSKKSESNMNESERQAVKVRKKLGSVLFTARNNMKRLIAIAALFALSGALACANMGSEASIKRSIASFEQSNVGFYSGYIENGESEILDKLKNDPRVAAAWGQKPIGPIEITVGNAFATIERKPPLPRATETLSMGSMPRREAQEVAFSPSLARKIATDISSIIGEKALISVGGQEFTLTVSGIYNAGYDDLFLSSDIEEDLCAQAEGPITATSFEVKTLADIVSIHHDLAANSIPVVDASELVNASLDSFNRLSAVFSIISGTVSVISLVAGIALTTRTLTARKAEFGLQRALGFTRAQIRKTYRRESSFLALSCASLCSLAVVALPLIPLPNGCIDPTISQAAVAISIAAATVLITFEIAIAAIIRKPIEDLLSAD